MSTRTAPLRRSAAVATFSLVAAWCPAASGQIDEDAGGKVVAVQSRPYRLKHEFTGTVGVLPVDPYYVGVSLGGGYTYHFDDLVAWEVASVHYALHVDTGLEDELLDRWGVLPDGDPRLAYFAGTSVVLAPLFGKISFFNREIIHIATHVSLGGGLAKLDDGFRPLASATVGLRVFGSPVVSGRLDLRNLIIAAAPEGVAYHLQVALSVSFSFGAPGGEPASRDRDDSTGMEALDELFPGSGPRPAPRRGE